MKTPNILLGVALFVAPSLQHVAIKPPSPDKALTPNSSTAPQGCKLLASDKGFPADNVWKAAFPNAFKKMKGTEGPDWWVQATSIGVVQKAVTFAKEHNVRLSVISTGHDFMGRSAARSGLRLDMAALMEPTVFANNWKCGDTLKPTTVTGRSVDDVVACKVDNTEGRNLVGRSIPQRRWTWHFFQKRDGQEDCDVLVQRHLSKRHGPDMDEDMAPPKMAAPPKGNPPPKLASTSSAKASGTISSATSSPTEAFTFNLPPVAEVVQAHNVIKAIPGKVGYARISGAMYNELFFDQADKSGYMTLGAQHGGVSVLGGWAQAGGHNPFVHKVGMQVDNIVELEVVTADGKFQKVSECSNPELFWALRGGGGNTFGIVTGGTVKVHPTFPVVVSRFFVNSTTDGLHDAVAYFLQNGAKLRDTYGLQGYFYMYPNGFQSVLHMPDEFATLQNAKKVTEPLMAKMEALAGAKHIEPKYYQYKTYKEWYIAEMGDEEMEESGKKGLSWYDGAYGPVPSGFDVMMNPMLALPYALANQQRIAKLQAAAAGPPKASHSKRAASMKVPRTQPMGRTYLDSRLLSDKHVNSVSQKVLAGAIKKTFPGIPGNHIRGFLYGGGEMAKPAIDALGLLPAWRQATYHFIINAAPGDQRNDYDISPIAKLFPDAGAYVNEASHAEPNWKTVFWGAHYPKLETIKKKYDPTNLFWCSPCVGADMMSYDDERICKNPAYPQSGPPPQVVKNDKSKTGISSLPGTPGIPNPLMPIIQAYIQNKTLPYKMPASNYFRIAMGEGGSAGGKFSSGNPWTVVSLPSPVKPPAGTAGGMHGMGHGNMV